MEIADSTPITWGILSRALDCAYSKAVLDADYGRHDDLEAMAAGFARLEEAVREELERDELLRGGDDE